MTTITIRFVTDKDIISKIIRKITWCKFSHVEFVLDNKYVLGAYSGGGVKYKPIYSAYKEERYSISCTETQKLEILGFAIAQENKGYDYLTIFGILFHRDWRNNNRWICSELVTAAFETGGLPLLHAPKNQINRITPRDLYLSPLLQRI